MLHGFTGNYETWKETIHYLKNDYMCIMPDIIGHGLTDKPHHEKRYQIEAVAEDLKNILQFLQIKKANILGYSMGGRLALTFAILFEEYTKVLILESASPGLASIDEREKRKINDASLAEKIVQEGIVNFVDYWQSIALFESQKKLSDEKKAIIYKQRISNDEVGLANSLLGMGTGVQPSWWDHLSNIQVPILLLTGEYDRKFCHIAKEMKQRFLQCEWENVLKVGHAIHVENPEKFGKIVSEFVEKWRV